MYLRPEAPVASGFLAVVVRAVLVALVDRMPPRTRGLEVAEGEVGLLRQAVAVAALEVM